jgi:alpha-L-rhamnosidase
MKTHTQKTPHRLANISLFACLLFATAGLIFSSCNGIRPADKNVDIYMADATINAFDMEDIKPSFSWKTKTNGSGWKQGAYRIVVADSEQSLESGNASVWDSKKRASENQLFIPYEGEKLVSGKEYYWKVMVWDNKGRPSPWSDHQTFLMPIDYDNDWQGEWITHDYDPEDPMPLFRKSFSLDKDVPVESALLYVCGLGYYEALLNGKKIGDRVLEPAQTNYEDYAFYSVYKLGA